MLARQSAGPADQTPLHRLVWGYALLIAIALLQEQLVFWHIYTTQAFTVQDLLLNAAALLALLAGLLLPVGISIVGVFVFFVGYLVWLATYAPPQVITISWLLLIPANILVATLIKTYLIRSGRYLERIRELERKIPRTDPYTSLGNKDALADAIINQSNLARRNPEQYNFSLALFKIDFLPLVQESLGSQRYTALLQELSDTIQKQIRHEDSKFFVDHARFVIICPMTRAEFLEPLTERIKQAMMAVPFADLKGRPLKLVIRTGALVFQPDQFEKYANVDSIIAALERNAETDLIGEYI
ncbi:GGDEF domain-containing protein [Paenibacillus sanguinis]|uniref:GGDEF domain-containing protein n=1 Tax=Paenibacillus sanguinis TaxID=225906 RepID=UPI0003612DCF|nr:diguanylate cyclase [Paenibacillus sanguinis]